MTGTLTLAAFHALAAACAPGVAPETLAAIGRAESGLRILAINVKGPGSGALVPASCEAAHIRACSHSVGVATAFCRLARCAGAIR